MPHLGRSTVVFLDVFSAIVRYQWSRSILGCSTHTTTKTMWETRRPINSALLGCAMVEESDWESSLLLCAKCLLGPQSAWRLYLTTGKVHFLCCLHRRSHLVLFWQWSRSLLPSPSQDFYKLLKLRSRCPCFLLPQQRKLPPRRKKRSEKAQIRICVCFRPVSLTCKNKKINKRHTTLDAILFSPWPVVHWDNGQY